MKTYSSSSVYHGNPDVLVIARDFQDVAQILKECHHKKIPVTFCGSRTAVTGSSMADEGVLIALEKKNRLLDILPYSSLGMPLAKAEPGIILSDLKREVLQQNLFYPPDPTSYKEAQLGGTVATNATGEDTLKYGPTRKYIQELKVLTAQGKLVTLTRHQIPRMTPKNKAGYFLEGEEIDWFIGSEGTLGLITEVTVTLLKNPADHFSLLIPFDSFQSSLEFVVQTVKSKTLNPRAVELIGPGAFEIFATQKGLPQFHPQTKSLIYTKREYKNESQKNQALQIWLERVQKFYQQKNHPDWSSFIFLGDTEKQKDDIRTWRHYIPAIVNERNAPFLKQGGGKISTDWWVPTAHILPILLWVFEESQKMGIDFLVFAHIGNGHPHWNYLTKNPEEKLRVEHFIEGILKKIVARGGGVAGEHGVGKIHPHYLSLQHPKALIKKMVDIKKRWDPHWILGRGNIFSYASFFPDQRKF